MLLEEQQIDQYRILRSLGSGNVYLARDLRLDRQVAIRIVHVETPSDADEEPIQDVRRLILPEIEKIVKLDHPSIMSVYYYGVETDDETYFVYMVTPFCENGSLVDWLQQQPGAGPTAPQMCARLVSQVAEALQYAHNQRMIHQHLSPSKILIRRRIEHQETPELWLTGFEPVKVKKAISGDPLYMAPEQWVGNATPESDQYALAVIAYRLLVGEHPFKGSQEKVKDQHLHFQPEPPSKRVTDLPSLLDAVLLRALAKQPEKRFVSVAAFASAFTEAAQCKNCLCSTLVISNGEARRGVNRQVALPGGGRINLALPAGAHDGQIIRLRGQGSSASGSGPHEDLLVIISIDETLPEAPVVTERGSEEHPVIIPPGELTIEAPITEEDHPVAPLPPDAEGEHGEHSSRPDADIGDEPTLREFSSIGSDSEREETIISANSISARITAPLPAADLFIDEPTLKKIPPDETTLRRMPPFIGAGAMPVANNSAPVHHYQAGSSLNAPSSFVRTMRDVFATSLVPHIQNVSRSPLVMRARGLPGIQNILILALVFLIIVCAGSLLYAGSADQQVEAALQARATAQIQGVSTAFASTASAQASVTATASYDPYPPVHGTLAFADPLRENGKGHTWQEVGSDCAFMNASYQVSRADKGVNTCTATDTLKNFAYQVQMNITQGDAGGVIFRSDSASTTFYYFSVSAKGSYTLSYCQNGYYLPILDTASSSAIHTGLGEMNLLAVVVQERNIDLFVNNQHLAGITDGKVVSGQIGVAAENSGNATEVTFSDVKIWNI